MGKKENLTFGEAIEALKQGKKVKRAHWGGYWTQASITATWDTHHRDVTKSVRMDSALAVLADGGFAAAQPYWADIMAEDWMVIAGEHTKEGGIPQA